MRRASPDELRTIADWVAFDPTVQQRLSERYVRVGHGRDYGDVAPLRGAYSGGSSTVFVTVEMTQFG